MTRIAITAVMALTVVPVVCARSCIVDAGTQTYEVSSAIGSKKAIVATRATSAKLSADVTETRRCTTALSSAGSLSTIPLGSVLILR